MKAKAKSSPKGDVHKKPTAHEMFGRAPKKIEPDDLPGHAQSSRSNSGIGKAQRQKRLKGVMI